PYYPADIQAAQARVAGDNSGYGAQPAPVVQGGAPAAKVQNPRDSVYFGH
ncbi:hypothetical protein B1M_11435, partial [Burkholderia sp. TJI49]